MPGPNLGQYRKLCLIINDFRNMPLPKSGRGRMPKVLIINVGKAWNTNRRDPRQRGSLLATNHY